MVSLNGTERRIYTRITYPPGAGASLKIVDRTFPVADISQCGLRFVGPPTESFPGRISGTVTLLCGSTVHVEAEMEWQENGEIGCSLPDLLPSNLLERELRYVAVHFE